MGKYVIAVYIITTLFLSGFAKAEQVGIDARLQDVVFEKSSMDFIVTGINTDGCTSQIMIAEQNGEYGEVIRFKVLEAKSLNQMCIQKVTYFTKRIPTKDLVVIANLEIKPEQVYTLTVANSPVAIEVLGSELLE